MEYIITEARPEDAEDLLEYLKIVGDETENLSFGAEGLPITVEIERMFLKELMESKISKMLVAKKDGIIIGSVDYRGNTRERLKHRGEIGISVLKSEWGKGVGTRLMEEIIRFAKCDVHAEIISLEVRSDNYRAIKLYEKFGFERIGVFKGFNKINGKLIDFDLMNLYIK